MKKIMFFGLTLLALGSALFADDAKVMPKFVGRFYLVPTFSFANGEYDNDGKYQSFGGTAKVFNLGAALEFGITDWITGAVQWTPGWTAYSDISPAAPAGVESLMPSITEALLHTAMPGTDKPFKGDLTVNGVADLFVGAKIQIVGEKAPVQTNMFRFSVAPGLTIPLPGPDFSDEASNALKGDNAVFASMDKHVMGLGGRVYFDYIINEHFFINLYNETLVYPIKQKLDKDGPNLALLKETVLTTAQDVGDAGLIEHGAVSGEQARGAAKALTDKLDGDVNYKYRLTFELEPQFSTPFGGGAFSFSAGLPLHYVYNPAPDYTVDGVDNLLGGLSLLMGGVPLPITKSDLLKQAQLTGEDSHILSINPNVSLFMYKTLLPLEFKLQYNLPLWGQNAQATNSVVFQVKAYFQI